MPLAYELAPIALDLDKPSECKYFNMDNDDYWNDHILKKNTLLNRIDIFFKENADVYKNADELKERVYSLFK